MKYDKTMMTMFTQSVSHVKNFTNNFLQQNVKSRKNKNMHTYICTCIAIHMYINKHLDECHNYFNRMSCNIPIIVQLYVCIHACLYLCLYGWMHACMYVPLYVWMYACLLHVCIYVCTYVGKLNFMLPIIQKHTRKTGQFGLYICTSFTSIHCKKPSHLKTRRD
jgi:hypothetical protein